MLEFRAGLAHLAEGRVTPDSRKGMLRIAMAEDLMHLQWLGRQGLAAVEPAEVDMVIFPGEASFTRVTFIVIYCKRSFCQIITLRIEWDNMYQIPSQLGPL